MEQKTCGFCHFPLTDNFYYCPNCGKKIKEEPITLIKQLGIYAFSVFLPPLGFVPGFRYLMQNDPKIKRIGIITIILSIISTIITIWITIGLLNSIGSIGQSSQLNQLQNLGY